MKQCITLANRCHRLRAVAFWLILWQVVSMLVGQRLLLASPIETLVRLAQLLPTWAFWGSVFFTLGHILLGFLAAMFLSLTLAPLSARFKWIEELFTPLLAVIRSIPVASFVIVALIWIPSRRLSILISLLIALPVLYAAILEGIRQTDSELLEMAHVFRMPLINQIRHVYFPSVFPRLCSAATVAIGLAWKSGVAAEVIGIPGGSIGEKLYKAKVYLATPDLFAWTLTIVALSALCERGFAALLNLIARRTKGK